MDIKKENIEKAEKIIRNGEFACYQVLDKSGEVHCIPDSENNRHYQELMKQEREGKIQITERVIERG